MPRIIGQERMLATLCTGPAGVALLLCCIGLYGFIAYDVTRRRAGMAIRLALGAQQRDVVRPILSGAMRLAAVGIVAGLSVVYGVTKLIQSQLHGLTGLDPVVMIVVVGILLAVAVVAAWFPAQRATRVDPLRRCAGNKEARTASIG